MMELDKVDSIKRWNMLEIVDLIRKRKKMNDFLLEKHGNSRIINKHAFFL